MDAASLVASAIVWLSASVAPSGLSTHRGYVATSPTNCAYLYEAFDPDITSVRVAYDINRKVCWVEVKQMTQLRTSMTYFGGQD